MKLKSFASIILSAAFALSMAACQTGGKCPLSHKEHKCSGKDCTKSCNKSCCPDKPCQAACSSDKKKQ